MLSVLALSLTGCPLCTQARNEMTGSGEPRSETPTANLLPQRLGEYLEWIDLAGAITTVVRLSRGVIDEEYSRSLQASRLADMIERYRTTPEVRSTAVGPARVFDYFFYIDGGRRFARREVEIDSEHWLATFGEELLLRRTHLNPTLLRPSLQGLCGSPSGIPIAALLSRGVLSATTSGDQVTLVAAQPDGGAIIALELSFSNELPFPTRIEAFSPDGLTTEVITYSSDSSELDIPIPSRIRREWYYPMERTRPESASIIEDYSVEVDYASPSLPARRVSPSRIIYIDDIDPRITSFIATPVVTPQIGLLTSEVGPALILYYSVPILLRSSILIVIAALGFIAIQSTRRLRREGKPWLYVYLVSPFILFIIVNVLGRVPQTSSTPTALDSGGQSTSFPPMPSAMADVTGTSWVPYSPFESNCGAWALLTIATARSGRDGLAVAAREMLQSRPQPLSLSEMLSTLRRCGESPVRINASSWLQVGPQAPFIGLMQGVDGQPNHWVALEKDRSGTPILLEPDRRIPLSPKEFQARCLLTILLIGEHSVVVPVDLVVAGVLGIAILVLSFLYKRRDGMQLQGGE